MSQRNEKVSFWRGKHATIPQNIITGRLLIEQDTGDVFFDFKNYDNGRLSRIQLTDTTKFPKSGGKFEGPVILYRNPTDDSDPLTAATKQYADNVQDNLNNHTNTKNIHVTAEEKSSWNNKVDKEAGKGLSTNDFTNALKNKLDGISDNANKTQISLNYNGDDLDRVIDLGYIEIDGTKYTIYAPKTIDIEGNSNSATRLNNYVDVDGVYFNGEQNINHFYICDTDAESAAKSLTTNVINYSGIQGSYITVYFNNDNIADNPSLNISVDKVRNSEEDNYPDFDNELTINYPIYYQGQPIKSTQLKRGLHTFVLIEYNGVTRWEILGSIDTLYTTASGDEGGLISAQDKIKLDSIEENANNYILPVATNQILGGVKIGDNIEVASDGTISINSNNIINALGYQPLGEGMIDSEVLLNMIDPFKGATESDNGEAGLVPMPYMGEQTSFLCGDGSWKAVESGLNTMTNDDIDSIFEKYNIRL